MKVRSGFVSNSSSSSFVIAYDGDSKPCPHCGRSDTNLLDIIRKSGDYDGEGSVYAVGADEVLAHLEEDFFGDDYPKLKQAVDDASKSGKQVAYVSISYHNQGLADMIANHIIYRFD